MMKKILLSAVVILAAAACKEQIPKGLILNSGAQVGDTTYVLTNIPTPDIKRLMIEEFTGVRCPNCPQATAKLKEKQKANPDRILVSKLHTGGLATPIDPTDPDLKNEQAEDIDVGLGGAALGQPAASFDRIKNTATGKYSFLETSGSWPDLIAARLAKSTPVNIKLTKTVSEDSLQVVAEMIFTDTTSQRLSYHLYINENKIITHQDSVYIDGGFPKKVVIKDYEQEEVFRACITTPLTGALLPAGLNEKGRYYRRVFNAKWPEKVIKKSNCTAILFVADATTREILHAAEIKL